MQAIQQSVQMTWWYMLQAAANGDGHELTLFHQAVPGECRGSPAQGRHLDPAAGNSPGPNAADVRSVLIIAEDKDKIIESKSRALGTGGGEPSWREPVISAPLSPRRAVERSRLRHGELLPGGLAKDLRRESE
jgi:hypothetical protein